MSQRSVSNTPQSKLPNLHSLNNCWCAMDCGLIVGVPLSCACCCHAGVKRSVIFKRQSCYERSGSFCIRKKFPFIRSQLKGFGTQV